MAPTAEESTMIAGQLPGDAGPGASAGAETPDWLVHALATGPERRRTTVEGTEIAYRVWGTPTAPGVLLVHGGAAHSGWWDHIAPLLHGFRVVAPDMSGYGDSGRRASYDNRLWARELVGVTAAEGLDRPVLVGHSKGGWFSITAAARHGDAFGGVVAIDSPMNMDPPSESFLRRRSAPNRLYAGQAAAVDRFVTLPKQEMVLPYVRRHIAENSVREVEGGWTWKFDPRTFTRTMHQQELLAALEVPFVYFRSEHGLVGEQMAEEIASSTPRRPPVVTLPASGHHPMLDHPLALGAVLRTLLAVWPGSTA